MRRDPFQAIADPNRRAILALIARESMNLNTVASHFSVSRPAISKHIKILRQCGLVEIRQKGRERYCEARLERLSEVVMWLEDYRSQWSTEIQTAPVAAPPVPAKDTDIEVTVTPEHAAAAAVHVPAETMTAIEVEGPEETEVIIEELTSSAVDEIVADKGTEADTPDLAIMATEEIQLAEEPVTEVGVQEKSGLVPWEEGYDETADTIQSDAEVSLSAEAVGQELPVKKIEPTPEIIQASLTESEPEPEPIRPAVTPARKPATRKKKESPPTDTLQGSLF